MKKIIIKENEKGLLFKNGKFEKLLGAGKYYTYGGREIEVMSLSNMLFSHKCPLEQLLADEEIRNQAAVVEVKDNEYALHYVNGRFFRLESRGKFAFWNTVDKHEFQIFDTTDPVIGNKIPEHVLSKISMGSVGYVIKAEVAPYEKASLVIGNKFVKILDSGTHYFWNNGTKVVVTPVDARLTAMNLIGQEMLTQDKVTLRINCILGYRVTDFEKIFTEVDNYMDQLHNASQLVLREYVGKHKLDEILENKAEMSAFMLEKLKAKEEEFFVRVISADVKDIILPGEVREIMNTVLLAEKKAQANVITRREEVASTRSLLNTAKLMDENKTLYKLKELEYLERIFENVNNLTIGGGADIVTALAGILPEKK